MDAENRQTAWNERWGRDDFCPFWLTDDIPEPVTLAFNDGTFNRGDRVLEIGCGSGYLAAHLAEQGLYVTAIDIAENAIARAIARFNRTDDRLDYQVIDFEGDKLDFEPFDAVLDQGCYHAFKAAAKARYITNLSRIIVPGGAFLLMHKTSTSAKEDVISEDELRNQVLDEFGHDFELVSQSEMTFGSQEHQIGGLGFVLRRISWTPVITYPN